MPTFTFPIPAEVLDCVATDWRRPSVPDAPDVVIEQVRAVWGDRSVLPSGAFFMRIKFPAADAPARYDAAFDAVALYTLRTLQRAGVLDDRFAAFSGSFGPGEATEPEVAVTMTQLLRAPEMTPAALPRKETPCAA